MSRESWKIEFRKITEVIDRLSYVGNKLKHTSSKLKVDTIANKQDFKNKYYRKAVTDQLLVICSKYKKRIEHIENICALRVKNILKSNSDTDKLKKINKSTWSELLQVNVPSQICLQSFTSCQVTVNRISGNKLRKYKLYTNSRHISSNTCVTSSDDDVSSVRHKQKKLKPNTNLKDNIKPRSAEYKSDQQSNTQTSEQNNFNDQSAPEVTENVYSSKEQQCSEDRDDASCSHSDVPNTTEDKTLHKTSDRSAIKNTVECDDFCEHDKKCSASKKTVHKHSKHSDVDSIHEIYRSKNDKNPQSNCISINKKQIDAHNNISEGKISKTSKHADKTDTNLGILDICPKNHSDDDVSRYDKMSDFELAISSDNTEIISDHKKSLIKSGSVDEFSDGQTNKLKLASSTKGTAQSYKEDIKLDRHKNRTIISSEDNDEYESSTATSDQENNQQKCSKKNISVVSEIPRVKENNSIVASDENTEINNDSYDEKIVSYSKSVCDDINENIECFNEEISELLKQNNPESKIRKDVDLSDKDAEMKSDSNKEKSGSLKLKCNEENEPDNSNTEIHMFSDEQIHMDKTKSRKAIISSDEDRGTKNVSDNDRSSTSTGNSEEENAPDECVDKNMVELPEHHKPKLQNTKVILSSDEETGAFNVNDNDKSVSWTSKINRKNEYDNFTFGEIKELSKQHKLSPKSNKTIVSINKDTGTKNINENSKSFRSKPKSHRQNQCDEYLDKEIPELSKQPKSKPTGKKTTVSSDQDTDTDNISDKSVSSTPKAGDENVSDKCLDTEKTKLSKQHYKPKPKSKKVISSSDKNTGTKNISLNDKFESSTTECILLSKKTVVSINEDKGPNVSENDKSVSSIPKSDDENVNNKSPDIMELTKQQEPKLKSKKTIISSDEGKGTYNVSEIDKTVSLTPKSDDENVYNKSQDTDITELTKQQKPKPKSKKTTISSDEDKGTNNISDNDESVSSTPKSDEENVYTKSQDTDITELTKQQKPKPKSKKTIISSDEDKGTNTVSDNDESVSSTPKSGEENVYNKSQDTNIKVLTEQQKPKPKSKKTIISSDEDKGTNNVSDNDKTVSSTPKSDGENVYNKSQDTNITELTKQQKPKPKSKKTIISSDEDKGTNNVSDNDKTVSSTPKSDDENVYNKSQDTDITELTKQQKPKPKSKKTIISKQQKPEPKSKKIIVSSDEDKGTCNVSDNEKSLSSTQKSDDENVYDSDTEITELAKQHKPKPKSKKTIIATDKDKSTNNVSNNGKSASSTPMSNEKNECDKYFDREITELPEKQKSKNKKAFVSNETDTGENDVSAIDYVDSNKGKTDEVSARKKEFVKSDIFLSKRDVESKIQHTNIYKDKETIRSGNMGDMNGPLAPINKDIPEQNTEISENVDATCNLLKRDKVISSSPSNEISSCLDKTINVLLDCKNVVTEEDANDSSEQGTRNKKSVEITVQDNNKEEFSRSLKEKCGTPTICPNTEGHSGIEEIILSDTDSEPNCANEKKENNVKKIFLKCVDISKLTSQVADKPSDSDHEEKKLNTKIKNVTTDRKRTYKKTRLTLGCQSDKPLVKLREFSVKVCRMPTFDQKFLKNHKLKVIKNYKTKQVVVELKQAERNERAKNDLLGDSSSSASIGTNVKPTKSPSSASKRKRQRRIMRAKERLMSLSSTDTEEELVQNALNKIKRELRMNQTDESPNKQSPNKRSVNKQSPHKQRKLFFSSRSSSETDEMLQKALKKDSNQNSNVKSGESESDAMGRSLRHNRGNTKCEQEGTEKEENDKSADTAIENLTNLKNLKKTRRGHTDTSSSEDGHQAKKLKQKTSPNTEDRKSEPKSDSENRDKIEKQITNNDDVSTIEDDDDSDSMPDMPKVFRMKGKSNADLAKQELLRDSGDTSATDKADEETRNKANKDCSSDEEENEEEKKKSNGKDSGKKNRSRSDRLLRGKLDLPSSSDERDSSTSRGKQQKPKVESDKDVSEYEKAKSDSDSDDSVDFKRTAKRKPMQKKSSEKESDDSNKSSSDGQTKKKRRRIKAIADSDASDNSDSGSEGEGGKKSGRKNIRKVIRKDQLEEATKKAAREERERVARIQDRQKLYNNTAFDESGKPDEVVLDKVVLDFDPETKEPLISVDPGLVRKLKPHQANGIKFMWDACFESVKQIKKGKGSGCILAHCMGLGKTLQVVSLTHTLLAHWELTKVRRVLVVCPLSTVLNWVNEFRMWLKLAENDIELNIFELSKYKQNYERSNQMEEWMECGGVCVLGYEMFRNLSADNPKKFRKKMLRVFQESLVDPGPDLVVCDEGHLLKNEKTSLSQSMNRIKTIRRIVLTGTPLQNNLKEYYCMVQFVKQNLLGKYNEYLNRFVNPITNGQYTDSTDHDIRIMKRRSHVLHKLLDGAVQRRDYGVLAPFLPPKHEYIIFITLTEVQIKLYTFYLENLSRRPHPDRKSTSFLFPDFQAMQRIWTHPLVLKANSERYEIMQQKKKDKEDEDEDSEGSLIDFIDDESTTEEETTEESSDESATSDDSRPKRAKAKKKNKKHNKKARSTRANPVKPAEPTPEKEVVEVPVEQKSENWTEWWMPLVTEDELEDMRNSNKLLLLFQILKECEAIGDKLLVFSQSLYSLDLIEHFLGKIDEATQNGQSEENLAGHIGSWSPGLDYFRLDGQTSCENRSLWCKSFNKESNPRARLFLISTRAGGLGINLVAANRVVIFDMSWNPSHDVQSIFRVYRFGQKKPCYIYRFLAMGTMEEKIYERQVTKQAISKRVIDEQQIDRHYAENDLAELYQFTPRPEMPREVPLVPKDRLFAEMLKSHEDAIYKYHEHDSLLENKEEETLTEEERKAAWDDFENEKNRPPPPPMTYNQNYNGINNMMNPNSVAFAALANMLRRDYPQLTDQQLAAMMPSILYQADPSLYGGYDFNMMNSMMNSQYANPAMQPNLMMNPGGGMGGVGSIGGAAVGGSALRGALGGMSGGLGYQPLWQQQQQMQMQRLMQQQQQQKAQSQAGMKFYAGGLGSRDPISMALQQQKQREMILGGGGVGGMSAAGLGGMSAGGLHNSSLPTRGRPPKPKPTLNNEVVTLDDSD